MASRIPPAREGQHRGAAGTAAGALKHEADVVAAASGAMYRPPHVDEIARRTFIGTTAIVVLGPVVDAQRATGPAGLDRKTLTAAVDGNIPAGETMPPASAAGAAGYIERLAAREPELAQQLAARSRRSAPASAAFRAAAGRALRTLERTDPGVRRASRRGVRGLLHQPGNLAATGLSFRKGRGRRLRSKFRSGLLGRVQQLPRLYRDRLMQPDRVDVVVIGAGAAGAASTWRLASRGVRVVCLEQGDWLRPSDRVRTNEVRGQLRRGDNSLFPAYEASARRTIRSSPPERDRPIWSCGTAWAAARCMGRALPAPSPVRLPRPSSRRNRR